MQGVRGRDPPEDSEENIEEEDCPTLKYKLPDQLIILTKREDCRPS